MTDDETEDPGRCEVCNGPADFDDADRVQCDCGDTVCSSCCVAFEGESYCPGCVAMMRRRQREALEKINDIRNDIIARQTVNWSAHIYPLVAALNEAGFRGVSHNQSREAIVESGRIRERDAILAWLEDRLREAGRVRSGYLSRDVPPEIGERIRVYGEVFDFVRARGEPS